jgi:hypothetical protein
MDNSYFSKRLKMGRMLILCSMLMIQITKGMSVYYLDLIVFNLIASYAIYSSEVFTDPTDVAHELTTFILLVQPETPMQIGAIVELILPASGVVSFDDSVYTTIPVCNFQGTEALPDIVPCTIEKNPDGREVITWTSSHDPVE